METLIESFNWVKLYELAEKLVYRTNLKKWFKWILRIAFPSINIQSSVNNIDRFRS